MLIGISDLDVGLHEVPVVPGFVQYHTASLCAGLEEWEVVCCLLLIEGLRGQLHLEIDVLL